jgi:hypothetical protein
MWESSRMMLPEHKEALLEYNQKKKIFVPPVLDEGKLQEIDQIIAESIETDQALIVTYAGTYETKQFWDG